MWKHTMIISIDLHNSEPAYLQIVAAVKLAIARGVLRTGEKLPPIRETAVSTRVNRNTVSRAYLELEHQGLVVARQGSGYFVTEQAIRQEDAQRREALTEKIRGVLLEANLNGTSVEELVKLVQQEAKAAVENSAGERNEGERDV